MQPDEMFGPVGGRCKPRHRNRRCIGRNDRRAVEAWTEILEYLPLDGFVFRRRLDDDFAIFHVVERLRRVDMPERRGDRLVIDQSASSLAVQITLNRADGAAELILVDVLEKDVVTCQRADMGNTPAHLSRTNNSNAFDTHFRFRLRDCRRSGTARAPAAGRQSLQ